MSRSIIFCSLFCVIWSLTCSGPPRTVFYSHGMGFRLAVPAGWDKAMENDRLFMFCCGEKRLIEAGGYRYPLSASELARLPEATADSLTRQFGQDQIAAFAEENRIQDLKIGLEERTEWAGHPSFRVTARGWSRSLGQDMVLDTRMLLHKENAIFYFLAVLMPASDYAENTALIQNVVSSFQVLD